MLPFNLIFSVSEAFSERRQTSNTKFSGETVNGFQPLSHPVQVKCPGEMLPGGLPSPQI